MFLMQYYIKLCHLSMTFGIKQCGASYCEWRNTYSFAQQSKSHVLSSCLAVWMSGCLAVHELDVWNLISNYAIIGHCNTDNLICTALYTGMFTIYHYINACEDVSSMAHH